jgi:hypothetical protein
VRCVAAAVELVIGNIKAEHRMGLNFSKTVTATVSLPGRLFIYF